MARRAWLLTLLALGALPAAALEPEADPGVRPAGRLPLPLASRRSGRFLDEVVAFTPAPT